MNLSRFYTSCDFYVRCSTRTILSISACGSMFDRMHEMQNHVCMHCSKSMYLDPSHMRSPSSGCAFGCSAFSKRFVGVIFSSYLNPEALVATVFGEETKCACRAMMIVCDLSQAPGVWQPPLFPPSNSPDYHKFLSAPVLTRRLVRAGYGTYQNIGNL